MADHVFGMMLTLAHRLREAWEDQRAHVWDTLKYDSRLVELHGGTMGILALGGIGKEVARRAHGFGMEV
jgi:phosphoglycerate dehydrogenase-like enzyme